MQSRKKRNILVVFDDIIADMINNSKLNPIETELFIRGWKRNISIVFFTQSYFKVPKEVRLSTTQRFFEDSKQKSTSTNCNKFIRCWF